MKEQHPLKSWKLLDPYANYKTIPAATEEKQQWVWWDRCEGETAMNLIPT